jgi:hypothetical protein
MSVIAAGEADCPFIYPDTETFWKANVASGPLQGAMEVVGEDILKAALSDAVEPYRTDDGGLRFTEGKRLPLRDSTRLTQRDEASLCQVVVFGTVQGAFESPRDTYHKYQSGTQMGASASRSRCWSPLWSGGLVRGGSAWTSNPVR